MNLRVFEQKSFFLVDSLESIGWITYALSFLLVAPLNQKFFKEKRVDDQIIWIENLHRE